MYACLQAMQSQEAEPSGAADTAQAAAPAPTPAPAPVTMHYTMGPDEHILQELDLAKAKPALTRVSHPLSCRLGIHTGALSCSRVNCVSHPIEQLV